MLSEHGRHLGVILSWDGSYPKSSCVWRVRSECPGRTGMYREGQQPCGSWQLRETLAAPTGPHSDTS